jgi:transposase
MMKLQDVILKAMAKKITWIEAAEIAGMSVRNMQRMRQRYEADGYNGLFDQRRGKRSIHRVPMETAEKVLALYRNKYPDFNVRHFHEKLAELENIHLSYSWVKQALQGAGLWRSGANAARIADVVRDGRCRECYCISMAASTAGSRMTATTT